MLDKTVFPLYIDGAAAMHLAEVINMAIIKPVGVFKTKYGTYSLHFINPDGRRRRLSVGCDYQHAQRLSVKFSDWLLEGKDPERELEQAKEAERTRNVTIREFLPVFMERHGILRSKAMQTSYHGSFKSVCRCQSLADTPIGEVSKGMVTDFMRARMKQDNVSAATVNKDAAFIKVMVSKAAEWEIIERNQLQGLKLFPDNGKREVSVTPEQIAELISILTPPVADIVEFLVSTGFRKENVLSLKIEAIRFHDLTPTGEVELVIKGRQRELFPIGPPAVSVLKRVIKNRKKGHVFINPVSGLRYTTITKTFDRSVRKLGLKANDGSKLRVHDLRHLYATWLHRSGVSLDSLRFLLGHKDRVTTDRYTYVDRLRFGDVLSLLPNLREMAQKKASISLKVEAS